MFVTLKKKEGKKKAADKLGGRGGRSPDGRGRKQRASNAKIMKPNRLSFTECAWLTARHNQSGHMDGLMSFN